MKNSPLSEYAIYLFNQGDNYRSYQMLGSDLVNFQGENGVSFEVWAPHAKSLRVKWPPVKPAAPVTKTLSPL